MLNTKEMCKGCALVSEALLPQRKVCLHRGLRFEDLPHDIRADDAQRRTVLDQRAAQHPGLRC